MPGKLYTAGVAGHYFNLGEKVLIADGSPLLASFTAAEPVAVVLLKQAGDNIYLWGVTVPKLIEFMGSPPTAAKGTIEPEKYFGLFKVPRADITSLTVLKDSETHNFKDSIDLLISMVPFLKTLQLRSAKHLRAWAKAGFEKCMKNVLKYGELEARRLAAEKATAGKRSEAPINSADAGKEIGARFIELKEAFAVAAEFYTEPFDNRFDNIDLGEDGKPVEASVTALRDELKCARPTHAALATHAHHTHPR